MRPDPKTAPEPIERAQPTLALRMAEAAGLTSQTKTKHLNVKVSPALFEAAARRVGSHSPAAVIEAGLAALATQDDLGPWLAEQWGALAELDPDILSELDI
jgi:hypothetical protein